MPLALLTSRACFAVASGSKCIRDERGLAVAASAPVYLQAREFGISMPAVSAASQNSA
nr:hypothetical protein [uncultured Campylobacter sp.]